MHSLSVTKRVESFKLIKFNYGTNINSVPIYPTMISEPYASLLSVSVTLAELDLFEL